MDKTQLPDLGAISADLANNLVRVESFADRMSARIDQLVIATNREDWANVGELARDVADHSRQQGYRSISALATRVREEAERPNNALGIRRSLIRLIGTSGRVSTG